MLTIWFSQKLKNLTELNNPLFNISSISNSYFFKISYLPYLTHEDDEKNQKIPTLSSWIVSSFTNTKLEIQLNFTNPLLVSSNVQGKDQIEILFKFPQIFQS